MVSKSGLLLGCHLIWLLKVQNLLIQCICGLQKQALPTFYSCDWTAHHDLQITLQMSTAKTSHEWFLICHHYGWDVVKFMHRTTWLHLGKDCGHGLYFGRNSRVQTASAALNSQPDLLPETFCGAATTLSYFCLCFWGTVVITVFSHRYCKWSLASKP